ncbi:MAG: ComF family protein [Clostridia bacterium]|nr:ComF family protein [Clostridia bacterium]
MNFLNSVLRAFFPERCPLCGRIIDLRERDCPTCRRDEIRISDDFCHSCGYDRDRCICPENSISLSHVTGVYIYSGLPKAKIRDFKFCGNKAQGKLLGDEMAFRISACFFNVDFDCVTFVPISKNGLRERGYNQSEILAERVAKRLFLPCKSLLTKQNETFKQHELDAKHRLTNLRNAFALTENADVKGKTVLLCDDVKTTGATLKECEGVLLRGGAKDVYCICIALSDYGDIFDL